MLKDDEEIKSGGVCEKSDTSGPNIFQFKK
jgi:hypothetical protein